MDNVKTTVSSDEMVDTLADVQGDTLFEHDPQDDPRVIILDSDGDAEAVERLVTTNHVHLPKRADLGFSERDRERHPITKGSNFDEIRPLLELLDDHEVEFPDEWV